MFTFQYSSSCATKLLLMVDSDIYTVECGMPLGLAKAKRVKVKDLRPENNEKAFGCSSVFIIYNCELKYIKKECWIGVRHYTYYITRLQ